MECLLKGFESIFFLEKNSRIIFAGDYLQSDFKFNDEKDGIIKFLTIVEQLKRFEIVSFGWEDIHM